MKKLNFNQLKNVKTPDEWIENALNIPKMKNKTFHLSKLSVSVIAASFVCVCTVSVLIATDFSHKVDVPVSTQSTINSDSTQSTAHSYSVEPYIPDASSSAPSAPSDIQFLTPDFQLPTGTTRQSNRTYPSQSNTVKPSGNTVAPYPQTNSSNQTNTPKASTSGNVQPVTEPSEPKASSPTSPSSGKVQPVTEPSETQGSKNPATESPTAPSSIAMPSTYAENPTEAPDYTQYTARPDSPDPDWTPNIADEPGCVEPSGGIPFSPSEYGHTASAGSSSVEKNPQYDATADDGHFSVDSVETDLISNIKFYTSNNSIFSKSGYVFCHITDSNGAELAPKYGYEELCVKTDYGYEYDAQKHGISLKKGLYTIEFFDEYNNSCTASVYVDSRYVYINILIYE